MTEIYVEHFSTDSVGLVVQIWGFIQSKETGIKITHVQNKIMGGTRCYLIDFHNSAPFLFVDFIIEISIVKCNVGNPERIKRLSSVSLSEGQDCCSASFHFGLEIL